MDGGKAGYRDVLVPFLTGDRFPAERLTYYSTETNQKKA